MGQRRHAFVVGFVIYVERMLLYFIFVSVFECLVVKMSSIQLSRAAALVAGILLVLDYLLTGVERVVVPTVTVLPAAPTFGLELVLHVGHDLVNRIDNVLRTLRHAPGRTRFSALFLRFHDLVLPLVPKHLVMLHLFLSSTLRPVALSYTFLFYLAVQQLILIKVVSKRQIKLYLLMFFTLFLIITILNV